MISTQSHTGLTNRGQTQLASEAFNETVLLLATRRKEGIIKRDVIQPAHGSASQIGDDSSDERKISLPQSAGPKTKEGCDETGIRFNQELPLLSQ